MRKSEKLNSENVNLNGFEIGHSSTMGYKRSMEDKHIIDGFELKDHTLVAVMDGHGGKFAAQFTSTALRTTIEKTVQWLDYSKLNAEAQAESVDLISQALVEAYIQIDKDLLQAIEAEPMFRTCGCTCVSAVITPTHVICASVGDSRCIVGSMATRSTTPLTEDHKPSNPVEKLRIEKAGAFVSRGDRVNGLLAMSRALGDFDLKSSPAGTLEQHEQAVICIPDVATHKRSGKKDEILVLASDGVFDVLENKQVIYYLVNHALVEGNPAASKDELMNGTKKRKLTEEKIAVTAQEAAESLVDKAYSFAYYMSDDISAIVLKHL